MFIESIPRAFSTPSPLAAVYAFPMHSPCTPPTAPFLGGVGKSPRIQSALRTINPPWWEA